MARRKRLTPPQPDYLQPDLPAPVAGPFAAPPIAQVAGDAASNAALQTLSEEMARARAEGRFIEALPLVAVDAHHLVRDRIALGDEDQAALVASLRARGQQTPIEVVALEEGRYGLIAGWRRLMALQSLHAETGEDRFAHIQARITRPGEAAEAYRAMVEENEIRVGLSYYERARIAMRAVEEGVYGDESAALSSLYATASRAKKSKIRSFITVVRALDGVLRFPATIGERLGLRLAKALAEDSALAGRIEQRLTEAGADSAEAEQNALMQSLTRPKPAKKPARSTASPIAVHWSSDTQDVRLSGPGVDDVFVGDLKAWLAARARTQGLT